MRSTRESEKREEYSMEYLSQLHIPHGVKQEGYDYRWVNTSIRGADTFNVEDASVKGWELVPTSRNSGKSTDPLNRNPFAKDYFCRKDVILMERPSHFGKREKSAYYDVVYNKVKSLRGVHDDTGTIAPSVQSINSF